MCERGEVRGEGGGEKGERVTEAHQDHPFDI